MSFILSHAFVEHRNTEINILHVATKWYLCVVLFETGMTMIRTRVPDKIPTSTLPPGAKVDQKKSFFDLYISVVKR